MSFLGERRTRRTLIWLIVVVAVLGIAVAACAIYLNDYYRADAEAIAAFAPVDGIAVQALEDNTLVYAPEEARTGFIFYPGGKVEYTAYAPLMEACAAEGSFVCWWKCPSIWRCLM